MAELKPCPFCGGNAEMKSYTRFWVVCDDCLSETTVYSTEEEAIEAWNRRANDKDLFDAVSNIDWGAEE